MANAHELLIPPEAERDFNARELLRVWAAGGSQHIAIATALWRDPIAWGIALVDLAKHISIAYELDTGAPRADVLKRVLEGFDVERSHATNEPSGRLVD